ncbi:MAG: isochorismatase family protein [Sutterellaceae bacterium]|nr:isochorismatase family protein [Burkholderiaceae bacterium]MDW8428983.1 isochorismatase family protein [Sutterellaceae bacterium]
MRITRENSALLVIDVQERLAAAIAGNESLIRRTDALAQAATWFGVPKLLTEHWPERLGRTVEPLRSRFSNGEIFPKTAFAATNHPTFLERVHALGRRLVLMAGMEAHVCVLQTALALREVGFTVAVIADCCGSRVGRQIDRELALARLQQAGCIPVSADALLYEWTATPEDARFRDVLALVKTL